MTQEVRDNEADGATDSAHAARHGRRRFLGGALALGAGLLLPRPSLARPSPGRGLALRSIHTGESLRVVYWEHGEYLSDALDALSWQLRDHRTDDVHPIDTRLLDLLHGLRRRLDTTSHLEVISGYRSPRTNRMLAARSSGVAKRSLHMEGQAIDIRVRGRSLRAVRDEAIAMHAGGVGFYPRSGFVHLDIGRPRHW